MRLPALLQRRWVRLALSRLRRRKATAPVRWKREFTLASLENRAAPDNALDILFSALGVGGLLALPDLTGDAAETRALPAAVPERITLTSPDRAEPEAVTVAAGGAAQVDDQGGWWLAASMGENPFDTAEFDQTAPPVLMTFDSSGIERLGEHPGGGSAEPGAPSGVSAARAAPVGLTAAPPSVDPVAAPATNSQQTKAAPTPLTPPSASTPTALPTTPSLAGFNLRTHQRLHGGTSAVMSTSAFAPTTRMVGSLDQPGSQHGQRPASFQAVAGLTSGQMSAPSFLHISQPTHANATGVRGSVSPEVLLGSSQSKWNPAAVAGQIDNFQPQQVTTSNPATDQPQLVMRTSHDGPSGGGGGGDSGGDGSGNSSTVTNNDHSSGTFTFTLSAHGTDSQGAYAIVASGPGTVSDDTSAGSAGSVTITSRIHRGGDEVTDSDPSITTTRSFDPSGTGVLLGFDLDGYIGNQYGTALSSNTDYSLSVTGSDRFSDDDTETDTSSSTTTWESSSDTSTYNDSGSDSYHQTVSGAGTARTYSSDVTVTDTWSDVDDESDRVSATGESDSETYHGTDNGRAYAR